MSVGSSELNSENEEPQKHRGAVRWQQDAESKRVQSQCWKWSWQAQISVNVRNMHSLKHLLNAGRKNAKEEESLGQEFGK